MSDRLRSDALARRRIKVRHWLPSDVKSLGVGSVPLLIALSVQNLSNLIFHVVVSRLIGPSEYGELAALLSVALVISVPVGVVQTVAAKRVAMLNAESESVAATELLQSMAKALSALGVLPGLALVAATPIMTAFLHVSWRPSVLIGPYLYAALLTGLAFGGLQGSLRFRALSTVVVCSVLARLVLGVALTSIGMAVEGAMLATLASQLLSLSLACSIAGIGPRQWRQVRATLEPFMNEFRPALLALGSFALLAQLDLVLARHYLDARAAGFYSGAGLIARAVLFLPGAVALVAFPRFARTRGAGAQALRWLHLSMAAVAIIVLGALPILLLGGDVIVELVLGSDYRNAALLVPLLAIAMGLFAIVNLLTYFHVAAATRAYRILLAGVVVLGVAIGLRHNSAHEIASVVVVTALVVVALMYHAARAASVWPRYRPGHRAERPLPDEAVDLTVVLPCHNSGESLRKVLVRLTRAALESSSVEVIVVSDGSTDDTVEIARSFGSPVKVIELAQRGGKGGALRAGLSQAQGRYIAFMDSDGDISPDDIRPFIALMELYQPDIILGSKRHPMSRVSYPATRRLMSWIYHKLARLLFRVNVRDTQTGLKMIRREVLDAVLPQMLEKRFAFDLELLVVARLLGFKHVFEAPVRIDYQFRTSVDVRQSLRILVDTLGIVYRRYVLNSYVASPKRRLHSSSSHRVREAMDNSRSSDSARGLRILVINWRDLENPDAGGSEVLTHELAKQWQRRGHEVELLTSRFKGSSRHATVDGIRIRRRGRLRRGTFHLLVQWELARLRDFDLIIEEVNSVPVFTALWRWRLPPLICAIHQLATGIWSAELRWPVAAFGEWAHPRLLRMYRSVRTVALSDSTRVELQGLGFENVVVIPPGHDRPATGLPLQSESDERKLVLFVGRLARNKRPDHAIAAFRRVKEVISDAELKLVGRGRLEQELTENLPPGAEMLGHVSRSELYALMAEASCIVVPSVREGWGLVVLEANSVGTPAVGYDIPGLRDAISNGETGLLVPAGNVDALGDAVVSLMSDPDARRAFGVRARARAEGMSWAVAAERWIEEMTRLGLMSVPVDPGSLSPSPGSMTGAVVAEGL